MKSYIEIILFATIPVFLLVTNLIPLNQKGFVLVAVLVLTIFFTIKSKMTKKELGFRTDNLKNSLFPYAIFTAIGIIGLILLSKFINSQPLDPWWIYPHLQWAFLPISVAQEFVYRSFAQTKLQKASNPFLAIIIVTILYSGMHILWKDPLVITMTFIGGLAWGYLWYKYPNFYLISISHALLNFFAIYFGFFPWLITTYFK